MLGIDITSCMQFKILDGFEEYVLSHEFVNHQNNLKVLTLLHPLENLYGPSRYHLGTWRILVKLHDLSLELFESFVEESQGDPKK